MFLREFQPKSWQCMARQLLYDSVSLQHLAIAKLLRILESLHGGRQEPRWVTAVHNEVAAGAERHPHCQEVMEFVWLGLPQSPADLATVFRIRSALASEGDSPSTHLGEAMSIVMAEELEGYFLTDDGPAYDFAYNRPKLGLGRVADTCALLENAVSMGEISEGESKVAHETIINFGRFLRDCKCF